MRDQIPQQHYCSQLPGAEHQLVGPPGNVLVYGVGERQFAYFKLSDPEKWRFSIRTTPERFLELTDMPGIKPARYLGRFHWVTIVDVRSMPPDYLQELVHCHTTRPWLRYRKPDRRSCCGHLPSSPNLEDAQRARLR